MKNRKFVPILESDLVAYLYHLMILCGVRPSLIHINSRVVSLEIDEKIDIVVGEVEEMCGKRLVKPHLAIEVKAFFRDFSHQQCWRGFTDLVGDLEKLGKIKCEHKYVVILDERKYLQGSYKNEKRRNVLEQIRNSLAQDVKIIVITSEYTPESL